MARARTPKTPIGRAWARTAGGNVKVTFTITPDQERALREEAFRRAASRGLARPDAGEIVRELLADWLRHREKQP